MRAPTRCRRCWAIAEFRVGPDGARADTRSQAISDPALDEHLCELREHLTAYEHGSGLAERRRRRMTLVAESTPARAMNAIDT